MDELGSRRPHARRAFRRADRARFYDRVEHELTPIWCDVFERADVSCEDPVPTGATPTQTRAFVDAVDQLWNVRLTERDVQPPHSFSDLHEQLSEIGAAAPSEAMEIVAPSEAPTLFFVHPAGTRSFAMRRLAGHGFHGGVVTLRPIPDATRLADLEDIAAALVHRIRDYQPNGPYLLGGLCTGGTLAYEIARQLHAAGEQLLPLILVDTFRYHFSSFGLNEILALGRAGDDWRSHPQVRSANAQRWRMEVKAPEHRVWRQFEELHAHLADLLSALQRSGLALSETTVQDFAAPYEERARFFRTAGAYRERGYPGAVVHALSDEWAARRARLRVGGTTHLLGGGTADIKIRRLPGRHSDFLPGTRGFADILVRR